MASAAGIEADDLTIKTEKKTSPDEDIPAGGSSNAEPKKPTTDEPSGDQGLARDSSTKGQTIPLDLSMIQQSILQSIPDITTAVSKSIVGSIQSQSFDLSIIHESLLRSISEITLAVTKAIAEGRIVVPIQSQPLDLSVIEGSLLQSISNITTGITKAIGIAVDRVHNDPPQDTSALPITNPPPQDAAVQIDSLIAQQISELESLESRRSLLEIDEKEIYERFDSIESYLLTFLGVYVGAIIGILGFTGGVVTVDVRHQYLLLGVFTIGLFMAVVLTLVVGSRRLGNISWKRFVLSAKKKELVNLASSLSRQMVDPRLGIDISGDQRSASVRLTELSESLKSDRGLRWLVGGPVLVLLFSIGLIFWWTVSLQRGDWDFLLFGEPPHLHLSQ